MTDEDILHIRRKQTQILNNVKKTCVLLQPTGGKDEANIVIMRKS